VGKCIIIVEDAGCGADNIKTGAIMEHVDFKSFLVTIFFGWLLFGAMVGAGAMLQDQKSPIMAFVAAQVSNK